MFENMEIIDRYLIYQGLLNLVKSNSGVGFHNNDQGHTAYQVGCKGKWDYEQWGDSPDRNRLYKMMHELSVALNETQFEAPTITEWGDFCLLAVEAYDKHKAGD